MTALVFLLTSATASNAFLFDGKGHFVERGLDLGFEQPTSALGLDAADIDGDGDQESFGSDQFPRSGGVLWEKAASGKYFEVEGEHGLGDLEQYSVWGVQVAEDRVGTGPTTVGPSPRGVSPEGWPRFLSDCTTSTATATATCFGGG
jgi:hypothetical protein